MSLYLSVVADQEREPERPLSRRFEGTAIRVGRAPDNDLVLPDPANHVSKHHCTIEMRSGRYVITDNSTNGLFINGAREPLGTGRSAVLSDGDRLGIGGFEVVVGLGDREASSAAPNRPVSTDAGPFGVQAFRPAPSPPSSVAEGRGMFESGPVPPMESIIPEGFNWLSGAPLWSPPAAPEPATPSDHLPADREFFRPPAAAPLIPDDWHLGDAPAALSQAAPSVAGEAGIPAPLRAFLEGAGLSDATLQGDPAMLMCRAGEIFRAMVDGMCALLATRAMIKGEYRVEQTQIGSAQNNPLKFTRDGAQAATLLLAGRHPGYLPGLEAVAEGFRDLKTHELALMAGMQGAAAALFRQFDPEQLKQRLDRHSILASLLPGARRARYWEIYEQEYRKIAQDVSEDARGNFGRAFSRAYEEQARKV
jgi:type VI secretion system protein